MAIVEHLKVCYPNETIFEYYEHGTLESSYMFITLLYLIGWFGIILIHRLYGWYCSECDKEEIKERVIEVKHYSFTMPDVPHRVSVSSGPVLISMERRKSLEQLSAKELEKIAGVDDSVEQENVTDYCYGGYKPIEVGEELVRRYMVIRKLGFGHFSTVWLCQDRTKKDAEQYVAVKVAKAAEMFRMVAHDEIQLLKCIGNGDSKHHGKKHVIQMMDFFQVRSINGNHTCISFELMGPSLLHLLLQSDYCGIHLSGVRIILKQILKGIVYLHTVCKIIHTDLKPENILIRVHDSYVRNLVDTSARYYEMGVQMPRTFVSSETWENYLYVREPVIEAVGKAGNSKDDENTQRPSSFPKDNDTKPAPERHNRSNKLQQPLYISSNIEVKIADLGNACWENRPFSSNIQTKQYRALEVILGAGYSFPADMWSVGCMAFELATAEYLFHPKGTHTLTSAEDHVLLICELLGSIPNYIAQRGKNAHNFFDALGNLKLYGNQHLKMRIWKTEDVLVEKYKWKRVDAIPFAALIEALIEPDPELRMTAEGALNSEWLNDTTTS